MSDITSISPFGQVRKVRNPKQGLEGTDGTYAMLLRINGPSRDALKLTKQVITEELGGCPSNPAIFDHLMHNYLTVRGKI
jgi:hypothetical protein